MYNGVSGGAHCPCAARNAAEGLNDQNFAKSARISNLCYDRRLQKFRMGRTRRDAPGTRAGRSPNFPFSL